MKITDFGLARATADASLTQSGIIAGTPLYMSPEQAQSQKVDHRTDLFSLGSVIYAMCTGHSPFRAANSIAVLNRVCEAKPRPIPEVNSAIPGWMEAIVQALSPKTRPTAIKQPRKWPSSSAIAWPRCSWDRVCGSVRSNRNRSWPDAVVFGLRLRPSRCAPAGTGRVGVFFYGRPGEQSRRVQSASEAREKPEAHPRRAPGRRRS